MLSHLYRNDGINQAGLADLMEVEPITVGRQLDRMEDAATARPSVHAMRTELDATDRRLMAIDDHLAKPNHELAREIEALREEK